MGSHRKEQIIVEPITMRRLQSPLLHISNFRAGAEQTISVSRVYWSASRQAIRPVMPIVAPSGIPSEPEVPDVTVSDSDQSTIETTGQTQDQ